MKGRLLRTAAITVLLLSAPPASAPARGAIPGATPGAPGAIPGAAPGDPHARLRAEAAWILTCVTDDGAIALTPERDMVVPYDASIAAAGLARAAAVTGEAAYATAAWRWLEWYATHQQPWTGYVTERAMTPDGWSDTGRIDATDSTAAMFLIALRDTLAATGDVNRLQGLLPAMRRSMNAIASTRDQRDGLYYALPGFPWKYTMDQAEVVAGLEAAAQVAAFGGRGWDAAEAAVAAAEVRAGVEALWAPATRAYDWGLHADGSKATTAWWRFYPSSTAQAWMVAFGVARGDRAAGLMAALQASHPDWDRPTATTFNDLGGSLTGYWPLIGVAFARTGDPVRALTGADRIRAAADADGRRYPFTSGTAGGLAQVYALAVA